MKSFIPLAGCRIGRFVVLEEAGRTSGGSIRWRCRCDCGVEKLVHGQKLRERLTLSCGCLRHELARARITHGQSRSGHRTPEYQAWKGLISRCENPKNKCFDDYGGRGIVVCKRWRESFEAFFSDMGPRPLTKISLDRIDVDGPYSPKNCRWATAIEQARNKRTNCRIEYKGESRVLTEWAEILGVDIKFLSARLINGMSVDQAFETPIRKTARGQERRKLGEWWVEYRGERRLLADWSTILGIDLKIVITRLSNKWSIERAFDTPARNDRRRKAVRLMT